MVGISNCFWPSFSHFFFFQKTVPVCGPMVGDCCTRWCYFAMMCFIFALKWQSIHQNWMTPIKIECCSGKTGLIRHALWPWWEHTWLIFCWMVQPMCPRLLLEWCFPLESLHQLLKWRAECMPCKMSACASMCGREIKKGKLSLHF